MNAAVSPESPSDDQLLYRANRGDRHAVSEIYQRYFEPLYQFIRLRVQDTHTAEDLTSIVFEKFIRTLRAGKGPQHHLRGWLFKVARNAIADHYHQIPTESLDVVEDWGHPTGEYEPETQLMHSGDLMAVREALGTLSAEQLDVLLLRFDQQLSLQETADVLGRNINTIKTLQLRALEKLRQTVQRKSRGVR